MNNSHLAVAVSKPALNEGMLLLSLLGLPPSSSGNTSSFLLQIYDELTWLVLGGAIKLSTACLLHLQPGESPRRRGYEDQEGM